MRTVFEFRVEPSLPENLYKLKELAYNMWWVWNPDAIELFRRVDLNLWETTNHNPIQILGMVTQQRLNELSNDNSFLEFLDEIYEDFQQYMRAHTWFSNNHGQADHPFIAYFSMEFGLSECLPLYSGGLGVLSGDHMKSASDLGLPLVGVSLLFQQGYFSQYLNYDGWQQESYPINDFFNLPISQVYDEKGAPLKIYLDFPGRTIAVQIWKTEIGRVTLYLLDTNLPENSLDDQNITDQLYGGDIEMRIKQEIVLGIGGIRALNAIGINPLVCHINEGHAAFITLERIRLHMKMYDLPFRVARVATGGGNVFTTHTPVPAGFDLFPVPLMRKYFEEYVKELGMTVEELLRMGRSFGASKTEPFNMAIMALANATFINGVSKLHAKVTREMVRPGFPEIPLDEIPISHVTNGVHLRSWISKDMSQLFDRYLGSAWKQDPVDPASWDAIERTPSSEFWRIHERRRERLVVFAREKVREQFVHRGAGPEEIDRAESILNPDALTIGFARRFATYKRATLLLKDIERLTKLLTDPDKPIQLIFAGKAHPHDDAGKEFIKKIVHFARNANVRDRIVFLENYNMNVARYLVQGVDVWLNTPRRPLEASGTSGMKVVVNGGLNLSILDGWWDEAFNPDVGWAIGAGEEYDDTDFQDDIESNALYELLENEVAPLFYDRGRDRLPHGWIRKMKASIRQLAPVFNTDRMVREYCEKFYMNAKEHFERLSLNDYEKARKLSEWKVHVLHNWNKVHIETVQTDLSANSTFKTGQELPVRAIVNLDALRPEDVTVELFAGKLDEMREITDGKAVTLELTDDLGNGQYQYAGLYKCETTGRHGLGVRIIPFHEDLTTKYEMALIIWAD